MQVRHPQSFRHGIGAVGRLKGAALLQQLQQQRPLLRRLLRRRLLWRRRRRRRRALLLPLLLLRARQPLLRARLALVLPRRGLGGGRLLRRGRLLLEQVLNQALARRQVGGEAPGVAGRHLGRQNVVWVHALQCG